MTRRVDLIASCRHYRDHMLPIFESLPAELQGDVHPLRQIPRRPEFGRVAMVAAWQDLSRMLGAPAIYVEHGAGQSYLGDPIAAGAPSYSGGGASHVGVLGYICPSQTVADRWQAPAVAVGCPKMDRYFGLAPVGPPSVCFQFHWDCFVCPETRSAFGAYQRALPAIVDRFRGQGFGVYGHAHPKWAGQLDRQLALAGMTVLATDDEVFRTAHILVSDNSSLGPEFMSLGRPVIWMNAPGYRRDVDHGGRFWTWAEHGAVDSPAELLELDLAKVIASDTLRDHRLRIVESCYGYVDGAARVRASEWIAGVLSVL